MDKTVKARFKQRADTAANWTAKNPVLLQGEIGYESDTNNLKVGDGKNAWASLPYVKEKLAKVATSGSYTDLSNKPTIPTVPSSLKNPYALTFTGGASGSYDGSAAKSVAIPAVDTTLSSTSTNAIQNKAVNTALTNKADKATTISGYGITDAKIENGTITLGNNSIKPLTAHQNISGKADKATTLAGYGITDAKISNGTITLGSNSITPLVSHQSLSAYAKTADVNTALGKKADKATTLSGYGITDAKISNGVITLGTGTITPLTSHQSLSNYYKKTEVDTLITNLKAGLVNVVDSIPTTGDAGKLYLVKTGDETQNLYTEYVYVNEAWEKLGTQKLDLSGYLTKTDASNTYLGKTAVASSAAKLNTDAGSVTQPIYFSGGVPKATSYTLGKSVPSNAVFTDTNNKTTQTSVTASDYTNYRPIVWGSSNSGTKGFTPTTVTDGVFTSANLYCQPSTGLIHATKFEGDLTGTASNASKVNNLTVETAVPANAKFTDTVYTHPSSHAASMITGLAKVATSGSYSDLSNKPTIPTIPASLPANGGNSATVNGHTVNSDVPENAKFTDTVYTLPDATSTVKGGVKVGSNITVSSGTISLTKANVTSALGYTPPTSNTTYSAGIGISLSGTTFSNSGVRTVTAGSSANQISVNTNGTANTITINNVANATKATQDGNGNNIVNTYRTKNDSYSLADTRRLFECMVPYGTSIPEKTDLNTITYLKIGNYYCSLSATAQSMSNCPTSEAFMMRVYSPLSTTIDNESGTWVYRVREVMTLTGITYRQAVSSGSSAGVFSYGGWKQVAFIGDIPKRLPADGGNAATVNGHSVSSDVPANAKFTDTNTTYSAGTGISLSGTTFSNSGVRAISSGSTNGTISVNTNGTTANVAVKGLGSAAYTDSTAYASASHTHSNIISTSQSDNPIVWIEII